MKSTTRQGKTLTKSILEPRLEHTFFLQIFSVPQLRLDSKINISSLVCLGHQDFELILSITVARRITHQSI